MVPWLDDPVVVYRAIDVLAFPSYREGLPNVVLEAQLCSVPVVGYRATGTVDAVVECETSMLVPVRDVDALAGALGRMLSLPPAARSTVERARREVAARFDQRTLWPELAARYSTWLDARAGSAGTVVEHG